MHKNRLQLLTAAMHANQSGGMEELQTDVMRFMAILAFCLVAIFALVQSIPLSPAQLNPPPKVLQDSGPETPDTLPLVAPDPGSPDEKASPLHSGPVFSKHETVASEQKTKRSLEPMTVPQPERSVTRPDPAAVTRFAYRIPAPKPVPSATTAPKTVTRSMPVTAAAALPKPAQAKPTQAKPTQAEPTQAQPIPEPEPVKTPAPQRAEPQKGFSLKFASAAALRQLVASNQVSFFALTRSDSWRLNERAGQLQFETSTRPRQMHEMLPGTVPPEVLSALARAGVSASRESVRWGVVLTERTSQQLQRYLRSHDGGALTIQHNGTVELEPAGGNLGSRGGPA